MGRRRRWPTSGGNPGGPGRGGLRGNRTIELAGGGGPPGNPQRSCPVSFRQTEKNGGDPGHRDFGSKNGPENGIEYRLGRDCLGNGAGKLAYEIFGAGRAYPFYSCRTTERFWFPPPFKARRERESATTWKRAPRSAVGIPATTSWPFFPTENAAWFSIRSGSCPSAPWTTAIACW